jgi:hypothetical protein
MDIVWVPVDTFSQHNADRDRVVTHWSGKLECAESYGSRPNYDGGWCLSDEVHEWLTGRTIDYMLEWQPQHSTWYVGFKDNRAARNFAVSWPL